jgi:hypothetical protein
MKSQTTKKDLRKQLKEIKNAHTELQRTCKFVAKENVSLQQLLELNTETDTEAYDEGYYGGYEDGARDALIELKRVASDGIAVVIESTSYVGLLETERRIKENMKISRTNKKEDLDASKDNNVDYDEGFMQGYEFSKTQTYTQFNSEEQAIDFGVRQGVYFATRVLETFDTYVDRDRAIAEVIKEALEYKILV